VVTDEVKRELSDAFVHSARGPIKVKGREEALPLHVIHAVAEGRAHYGQLRRHTRFTAGRKDEQARVSRAVEAALAGRGRLLGLRGETGTGKSHLLSDLVDQWVTRGGVAVVTRCRYATRAVPLAPVRELFSAVIGSGDGEDEHQRSSRLRRYLSGLDLGMDVRELVSILQPTRRPDGFDEAMIDLADLHARDRLVAALVRVLDRRVTATDSRLLYVVEDLHHADSITLQLAQGLSLLPRDRAFLVVGTWRPGPGTERMDEACDEVISLGPLDVEATAELVRHEMRAQGVDPSLAAFFWRRTAGNPEHLVQTVRFLADRLLLAVRGETVVAPSAWRDRLEDLVPPRWEHVALARLDGLNELERRVLRTASAIGPHFGADLVLEAAAATLDPEQVSDALGALESHRILAPDLACARGWRFRDEATRAIAYQIIPPDERVQVHRRIADSLERGARNRTEVAAAIAHHRERAGQIREALAGYGGVAKSAFRAGLELEAQHFAEKWAQLHDQLPPGDPIRELNAPWLGVIRAYLTGVGGKPRQALETGLFARSLAQADAEGLWVPQLLGRLLEPLVARAAGRPLHEGWRAPEALRRYPLVQEARPDLP
jgi:predicted ATPase